MSLPYNTFELFDKYIIYYPDEDEPGFDGIHYGGIKGISEDAPEEAQKAFKEYQVMEKKARREGYKL